MAAHANYPNLLATVADEGLIALAVELAIPEVRLQWLIAHDITHVRDVALCAPTEELFWTKIITPMTIPETDLGTPAKLVEMWELARARRRRDQGEVTPSDTMGYAAGAGADSVPRMSPDERNLQKNRWTNDGHPLPEDDEFPGDSIWDAFHDEMRKKTFKVWELDRILSRELGSKRGSFSEVKSIRPLLQRLRTMMSTYVLIGRASRKVAGMYVQKLEKLAFRDPRPDVQLLMAGDRRARQHWLRVVCDDQKPLDDAILVSMQIRNDIWSEEVTSPAMYAQIRKDFKSFSSTGPASAKPGGANRKDRSRSRRRSPPKRWPDRQQRSSSPLVKVDEHGKVLCGQFQSAVGCTHGAKCKYVHKCGKKGCLSPAHGASKHR